MTVTLYYRSDKQTLCVKIQHKTDKSIVKIAPCAPKWWSASSKMITAKHPDFEMLYPELMDLLARAKVILKDQHTSVDRVKSLLFAPQNEIFSFTDWVKNYLAQQQMTLQRYDRDGDLMERNRTAGHIKHYNDVLRKLLDYYGDVQLTDLDRSWVKSLQYKLFNDPRLSDATAARYLSRIKSLHRKMVLDLNLPTADCWNVPIKRVTKRAFQGRRKRLNDDALLALYNNTLTGNARRAADLYMCLYELGGCDLVDFYYLKWADLVQGYVSFERSKIRGSGVTIMLTWHVWRFIASHGDRTSDYLFPWGKNLTGYKTWQRNATRDLKKACDTMQIKTVAGDDVSFKTARHTFSSRAKDRGVDGDLLRELMGHQRNDVDNYYKDLYPQLVRDNAQLRVIDF